MIKVCWFLGTHYFVVEVETFEEGVWFNSVCDCVGRHLLEETRLSDFLKIENPKPFMKKYMDMSPDDFIDKITMFFERPTEDNVIFI